MCDFISFSSSCRLILLMPAVSRHFLGRKLFSIFFAFADKWFSADWFLFFDVGFLRWLFIEMMTLSFRFLLSSVGLRCFRFLIYFRVSRFSLRTFSVAFDDCVFSGGGGDEARLLRREDIISITNIHRCGYNIDYHFDFPLLISSFISVRLSFLHFFFISFTTWSFLHFAMPCHWCDDADATLFHFHI